MGNGSDTLDPRASFAEVVERAASDDSQEDGAGEVSVEERRAQLLAYRQRVEQARLEHESRLQKLSEAQSKIEAELQRMEQQQEARRSREQAVQNETRTIEQERARLDAERSVRASERQRIEEETRRIEEENRELEERRAAQAAEAARIADEEKRAIEERDDLARRKAEQEREAARAAKAHLETVELRRQQVGEIQRQLMALTEPAPAAKPAGPAKAAPASAPKPNTRRSPRFEIHAAVRFKIPGDVIVMRARNISMTGALLATEAATLAKFPVGSEHTAHVFLSESAGESVAVQAQVVRHEDNALIIDWSADVESSFRVALLIATLPPASPIE